MRELMDHRRRPPSRCVNRRARAGTLHAMTGELALGLLLALGSAAALNWGYLAQHGVPRAAAALAPAAAPLARLALPLAPLARRLPVGIARLGALRRSARARAALARPGGIGRRDRTACATRRRAAATACAAGMARRRASQSPGSFCWGSRWWAAVRRSRARLGRALRSGWASRAVGRRSPPRGGCSRRVRGSASPPASSTPPATWDEGGVRRRHGSGSCRGSRLPRARVRRAPARLPARRRARDRRRRDAVHERAADRGRHRALRRGASGRRARGCPVSPSPGSSRALRCSPDRRSPRRRPGTSAPSTSPSRC